MNRTVDKLPIDLFDWQNFQLSVVHLPFRDYFRSSTFARSTKKDFGLYIKRVAHSTELLSDAFLQELGGKTDGYSGRQLEDLVNRAALDAICQGAQIVERSHFRTLKNRLGLT